jgi:curved DNA-binding protein CbpA
MPERRRDDDGKPRRRRAERRFAIAGEAWAVWEDRTSRSLVFETAQIARRVHEYPAKWREFDCDCPSCGEYATGRMGAMLYPKGSERQHWRSAYNADSSATSDSYALEATLYSVRDGRMIWMGRSESMQQLSTDKLEDYSVNFAVENMTQSGFIR